MIERGDLLRGTLEMLILQTLRGGPRHGWGITEAIRGRSHDRLAIMEGSMYPALYRMQRRGWIRAQWGRSENNRRAKFYALTATGRAELDDATDRWAEFTDVVAAVMDTT